MAEPKTCDICKYFLTHDTGYSNYTVCETTVYCLKNKNKYFPVEESFSWVGKKPTDFKQLRVAEECEYYEEGEGIHIDVEDDIEEIIIDDNLKDDFDKWAEENY